MLHLTKKKLLTHFKYTNVPGFFLQDDPNIEASGFDYTAVNFGLIDQTYDTDTECESDKGRSQWQRFECKVSRLNCESASNVQYKVFFIARHGQGEHNVAERLYGTQDWDSHWSKLDGNGTSYWVDAHLTELGKSQALKANESWARAVRLQRIPVPQTVYSSPLHRCLTTASLTFDGLPLPGQQPLFPQVKELLREVIGVHTCDRRSSKTSINDSFPNVIFETGFTERDELWRADVRETESERDVRLKTLLDDVFAHDQSTYISFTSHSGAIAAILQVIGHGPFRVGVGGVIPVLVKAVMEEGEEQTTNTA